MQPRELDVESVAHAVIAQVAPDELPYFSIAAARFRADPDRRPKATGTDDTLGFGEHLGVALSPLALWLTQEVLAFTAGVVLPVVSRTARPLRVRILRLLRRVPGLRHLVGKREQRTLFLSRSLTADELAAIRSVCVDRAAATGMPSTTAELLADAIVGRLVLPT